MKVLRLDDQQESSLQLNYTPHQLCSRCWCGEAGVEYDRHGALATNRCEIPCTGDASLTCGGYDSFQLYTYETLEQPEGERVTDARTHGPHYFSSG